MSQTDIEIVNLESLDWELPCETHPNFSRHKDTPPATWIYFFKRPCGCFPIQYYCEDCNKRFEELSKFWSNSAGWRCPWCNARHKGGFTEVAIRKERLK